MFRRLYIASVRPIPEIRIASFPYIPSTGHRSNGTSPTVDYPYGQEPKRTFLWGTPPQNRPAHNRKPAASWGPYTGIKLFSRPSQRPHWTNSSRWQRRYDFRIRHHCFCMESRITAFSVRLFDYWNRLPLEEPNQSTHSSDFWIPCGYHCSSTFLRPNPHRTPR